MSLWTITVLLSAVLLLMHSSDGATVSPTPRITSSQAMANFTGNLKREMQYIEKSLTPLRMQQRKLQQAYNQYSTRTARHGWNSATNQHQKAHHIRHEAMQLRSIAELARNQLAKHYARQMKIVQAKKLNRFRNEKVANDIEKTTDVYKRIVDLLINMIQCPIHILEMLGGDGDSSESTVSPTTIGENAEYTDTAYYEGDYK
ncbi:uncharacterized protein LOC129732392 [Wyeomyia smithii]|uniref:uncharacterized protein LOC129732392 n=1 Tax=Wyeomyia smithii TaxID=174621 RepID=UPI002467FD6D|nr:uncharacterized protein LOC129732392 [Wyeomyia smithii]